MRHESSCDIESARRTTAERDCAVAASGRHTVTFTSSPPPSCTDTVQRVCSCHEAQEANAPGINLLPLLTELRPDIPVLCEHTGAGYKATHAQHKWSWVLWAQYVFLVDREMKVYAADDLRTLLHMAQ